MPRRATRARRIKLELDIEVTIIFVFANSFSQIHFEVGGGRASYGVSPTTPPDPNGTDDRALARALALTFPTGAIAASRVTRWRRRSAAISPPTMVAHHEVTKSLPTRIVVDLYPNTSVGLTGLL
jgi:hypothetical protein